MKGKKLVCILVAVIFAFSVMFTGCGTGGKETESTAAKEITVEKTTEELQPVEELQTVELIWYLGGGGQPADAPLVEEAMSRILKEKINASIKLNTIPWGQFQEKMNVMTAAGEPFDLCYSAGWMGFYGMAAKGAYADLTELLPKYAPDYMKIPPSFLFDACKVKGKLLGTPNLQGLAMPSKIRVREDLYNKYNCPAKISKLDDMDAFLDAVKKGEQGVTPWMVYAGGANTIYNYYQQFGDLFFVGDSFSVGVTVADTAKGAKVVNQYESDNFKEFIKWTRKAYTNGWFEKDAATVKTDASSTGPEAGKYACFFDGAGPQSEALWSKGANFTWKYVDCGVKPTIKTNSCVGTMTSISINSKNKERAMMLINLINTDIKLYNTMCYGVEGTHYVLKDGHVDYPEGVTGDKSPYNPDTAWEFGNSFNAYPRVGVDPAAFKAQQEFDKVALAEPALGFSFDPTPVKTELAQTVTVLEELLVPLVAGSIDVDANYPKLLENLKTAGSDKIIAEKQRQLDEFLATRK